MAQLLLGSELISTMSLSIQFLTLRFPGNKTGPATEDYLHGRKLHVTHRLGTTKDPSKKPQKEKVKVVGSTSPPIMHDKTMSESFCGDNLHRLYQDLRSLRREVRESGHEVRSEVADLYVQIADRESLNEQVIFSDTTIEMLSTTCPQGRISQDFCAPALGES
jgi:hypothetical protein